MEKADTNWYAINDAAIMELIGQYVRDCRLKQNKTQQQVATAAGIYRSTLVFMEKGRGGTLSSLIQVLRVLGQLHLFEIFKVEQKLSPLQLAKLEHGRRQRAGKSNNRPLP
jgi:transcriptional regulator with XRE-family HTH domain